jgi:HTH-type transcriptional regulator/antitoxin HigA
MGNIDVASIAPHWEVLRSWLQIDSDAAYNLAMLRLNQLFDEVGNIERHPLYGLLETLGTVVHAYEVRYEPIPEASGREVLQFLMEEHRLAPPDLPELGPPAAVAAVLSGAQTLTVPQIRALGERFHVSPAVFV